MRTVVTGAFVIPNPNLHTQAFHRETGKARNGRGGLNTINRLHCRGFSEIAHWTIFGEDRSREMNNCSSGVGASNGYTREWGWRGTKDGGDFPGPRETHNKEPMRCRENCPGKIDWGSRLGTLLANAKPRTDSEICGISCTNEIVPDG